MTYEQQFNDTVDSLRRRAKAAGISVTEACRRAGVSRSTPDKWRTGAPKTIRILDDLERVISQAEAAKK